MSTSRRLVRAAASLFGLGALVGGVPALLIGIVGWPLPHGVPTVEEVRTALGDGWRPGERFVLGFLALLFWIVWAQILRHLLGHVRLVLRLRQAAAETGDQLLPQVAFASTPRRGPVQRLVGWLVGGLMMVSPLSASANMGAPSPRIPVVLTVTQAMDEPLQSPGRVAASAAAPGEGNAPRDVVYYVVLTWEERRECLWNIALRYLGDGLRYVEILELNRDRVQPDGRRLGDHPSSWVFPGWVLVLPPEATGPDLMAGSAVSPASLPTPSVGPIAAPPAPPATGAPTANTAAPTTVAPPTTVAAAPRTSSPSSTPARAAPPSALRGSAPQAPTHTITTTPGSASPASGKEEVVSLNPWALRAAMAGALGLPVFALGGWLTRLRRGRAAQASRCRPGRDVVRPADPEAEILERRARAIAADQAEEWVDAAVRALTAALSRSSLAATPQVRCVRAGEMGIEVLLGEPFAVAPEGWEAADGGHVWRLSPELGLQDLQRAGAGYPALTPALVSLGATPEGPILADLEGFGALAVEGDAERVRSFLAGAALELSSASWAAGVDLRVYGLGGFERWDVAPASSDELLREARSTAELMGGGLAPHGSALGARAAGGGEPWYPMVVVAGPEADPPLVEALAEVAAAGTGVALVASGALAAAEWQLVVGPDGAAVLKPLGLGVRVGGVVDVAAPDEAQAFSSEAVVAEDEAGVDRAGDEDVTLSAERSVAPTGAGAVVVVDQGGLDEAVIGSAVRAMEVVAEVDDVATPTPFAVPAPPRRAALRRRQDCEVWVAVLRRSPEVTGWAKEPRGRRKLAEVLMYLSIYGAERPIPAGELRANCWPPKLDDPAEPGGPSRLKDVTPEAFHQGMSRLRKQLGEGAAGWHLPLAVDGTYRLGPGVGCDWVLFQGLVAAGANATGRHETAKAIALYREALELVEGEPFADVAPGSCTWADSKHLITDIQLAVSKAASELARLATPADPETAVWATQQGLLLLPTQLELFDRWMTAAAELGDIGALERSVQAKCWALEQLDPDADIPSETMDLYRHLKAKLANKELAGQVRG